MNIVPRDFKWNLYGWSAVEKSKLIILPFLFIPLFAYSTICELWYGFSFESNPAAFFEAALNRQCAVIDVRFAGQEISRTDAASTSQTCTILTEWHPTLKVKKRVIGWGR